MNIVLKIKMVMFIRIK